MIRTIIILLFLVVATLYLPAVVQVVLYAIAVVVIPYRFGLFIPAILSDALYGIPSVPFASMIMIVAVLLLIRWVLAVYTRIGSVFYGVVEN